MTPPITKTKLKSSLKFIDTKLLIKTALWIIFCTLITVFTVLFIFERARINGEIHSPVTIGTGSYASINDIKAAIGSGTISSSADLATAYNTMFAWANYPLIDFSLMVSFFAFATVPPTSPATGWTTRSNAIDMAYSYMFITALIAIVALMMMLYLSIKMFMQHRKETKFGIVNKYSSNILDYKLFHTRMLQDFIMNLAIVFAFFNFLSTIIVLGYWLLLYSIQFITTKLLHNNVVSATDFTANKSDLIYLIGVMIFQNTYTLVKSIFMLDLGVNLDLIFSIILPIGTITVIIGLFIKNMMSSKVSGVISAIKTIGASVSSFRVFFYTQKQECLNDYGFVRILPPMIKTPLTAGTITKEQAYQLMSSLDDMAKFIEATYPDDDKQRNYMLYILFNNVTCIDELNEIKANISKVNIKTVNASVAS